MLNKVAQRYSYMDTKDINVTKGITSFVISGAYCNQDHKRHTYMDTRLEINASGADCCIPIYYICIYTQDYDFVMLHIKRTIYMRR